jgi:hypothetical protein
MPTRRCAYLAVAYARSAQSSIRLRPIFFNKLGVSMNTILKVSAAGALALGAVAAHASISVPSSGTSDAILFAEVLNSAGSAVASYAGDTGVSISSLAAGLSGSQTVLGSDANLAKLFAADVAGDTIQWAVMGGQYTGNATTSNFGAVGSVRFITTSTADSTAKIALDNTGNLIKWATLSNDVNTINSLSGGASSIEGAAPATAGQWDYQNPASASGWYSNGPVTANALGGTQALFSVTGGGSAGAKVQYSNPATETASLSASGLTLSGGVTTPPPVPLPAAVWLFGSGLLGLTGIARRKSKA